MAPLVAMRKLPSASGLPNCWNMDMELRLGYLEAQDRVRDFTDIVRTLKDEFPDLADYVISAESVLLWIQWLDGQGSPRGDSYRAGITAGHVLALQNLQMKGIVLAPISGESHTKLHNATSTGAQTRSGVRLVENGDGIDSRVPTAAGELESTHHSTSPSNVTPSRVHSFASRTPNNTTPATPTTPSSGGNYNLQSNGDNSQGNMAGGDNKHLRHLGVSSGMSRSHSSKSQSKSASTTSASLHSLGAASRNSYTSKVSTPADAAPETGSASDRRDRYPQWINSTNVHTSASFARLASSGSVVDTPSKTKVAPVSKSSPSSATGLRERRRLGALNVATDTPKSLTKTLPQVGGKENKKPTVIPAAPSADGTSLRERVKAKLARK